MGEQPESRGGLPTASSDLGWDKLVGHKNYSIMSSTDDTTTYVGTGLYKNTGYYYA